MAFNFQKFLFGQLPVYYKLKDTYKNNNDEGLLERYLEIFGLELNQEITPMVENYLDIIDPFTTDAKFLNDLAYTLGSPPDLLGNPNQYAKLLAYIIQIYKIKGTAKALELLFALLGFTISVIEFAPSATVYMDDSKIMDDGHIMDGGCPSCSDYEVIIHSLLTPSSATCQAPVYSTVNNTILATFIKIIEFNQPINAELRGLIAGGLLCEELNICMDNTLNLSLIQVQSMDNTFIMDNLEIMDNDNSITSVPVLEPCAGAPAPLVGIGFMRIGTTNIIG